MKKTGDFVSNTVGRKYEANALLFTSNTVQEIMKYVFTT